MIDADLQAQDLVVKDLYERVKELRAQLSDAEDAHDEARIRYWQLVKDKTRTMCGHDGGLGAPGYLLKGWGP